MGGHGRSWEVMVGQGRSGEIIGDQWISGEIRGDQRSSEDGPNLLVVQRLGGGALDGLIDERLRRLHIGRREERGHRLRDDDAHALRVGRLHDRAEPARMGGRCEESRGVVRLERGVETVVPNDRAWKVSGRLVEGHGRSVEG